MKTQHQPVSAKIRELTSATNSLVKVFRRALAEGLTHDGWLCGEGPHFLEEALKPGSRATVRSVLVSAEAANKHAGLLGRIPPESELAQIPDRLFHQIAGTRTPQGVAAIVELHAVDLKAVAASRNAILVIACGLQDPGNMGTIIRSADALGASAVVALAGTVNPFNPKAVRSCVGSIFRMPVVAGAKSGDVFRLLRDSRVRILGTDPRGTIALSSANLHGSIALLVGQEAAGLPPEISREADELLRIPIRAEADSLNAAMATGIFLYEVARQRKFQYQP
ncbi:MAG TPA: RNA methyltransferase [Terriglobia bacterium]|nr:RNA methyltransferase [Terriglobia bacterium]